MGGGNGKFIPVQLNLMSNNDKLCRNQMGVHIEKDMITIEDVDNATNQGYIQVYSNCFSDNNKIKNFEEKMGTNPNWKFKETRTSSMGLGWCPPGSKRYVFDRIQPKNTVANCCNLYTKDSNNQTINCDEFHCKGSDKCTDHVILEGCLHIFDSELINRFSAVIDKHDSNYSGMIKTLKEALNPTNCSEKMIKNDSVMVVNKMKPLLEIILNKLEDPDISDEKRGDLIDLLSSNLFRYTVWFNDRHNIGEKLKKFCKNTEIFNKKTFKDGSTKKYDNICSCFWDSTLDNGNPAYIQRNNIKNLKNMELPKELEEYFKYATDIEPSGPNQCWFNSCRDRSTLEPNNKGCPTVNIANCLSYINFTNEGTIIADSVKLFSKCKADINSKVFKLGNINPNDYTSCSQANYPIYNKIISDPDLEKKYIGACNNDFNRDGSGIANEGITCKYCNNIKSCVNTDNLNDDDCNTPLKSYENTTVCYLTGYEDKEYLEKKCEQTKCEWCDKDFEEFIKSSEFSSYKSESCDNTYFDKDYLESKCNILKSRSKSNNACSWCSDIDKYIDDNTEDGDGNGNGNGNGNGTKKDEGLSTLQIVGIICLVLFVIFVIIIIIIVNSRKNNVPVKNLRINNI